MSLSLLFSIFNSFGCVEVVYEDQFYDYPIIKLSSEQLEFGSAPLGESRTRTVTLSNQGDLAMGLLSIEAGPGQERNFAFSFDPLTMDCPDGTLGSWYSEDAQAEGSDSGLVTEASLARENLSADTAGPGADLSVDPAAIDFGEVIPPNSSTQWFTFTNTGELDLNLYSLEIEGSSAFSLLNDLSGRTLVPGATEYLYVFYQPGDLDGDSALLVVESNDADQPLMDLSLEGNMPDDPSGGSQDTGSPSGDPGDSGGAPGGGFTWGSQVELVLDPGCQLPVDVTMTPIDSSEIYGSLIFTTYTEQLEVAVDEDGNELEPGYYADPTHKTTALILHGEGQEGTGDLLVQPRSLDLGHAYSGETAAGYIEINNRGTAAVEMDQVLVDSSCDEGFEVTHSYEFGDEIPPGETSLIEVTYTATDTTASYCTLGVQAIQSSSSADTGLEAEAAEAIEISVSVNVGSDPNNTPPQVEILHPPIGYIHPSSDALPIQIGISDAEQPVSTLYCRVRSEVLLEAGFQDCTPTEETGSYWIDLDLEAFDPGVDTLRVVVADYSGAEAEASVAVIIQDQAETSDDDGDGFGDGEDSSHIDCDDHNINTYPDAAELFDGEDNDCDHIIDEGTEGYDDDGDRFDESDGDCNDFEGDTYPGAPEDNDGRDNDCDGTIDEGTALHDDDGDGYADVNNDCDDSDPNLNPGATEICNGIDDDCNSIVDDDCLDLSAEPVLIGGIQMQQTSCEEGETLTFSILAHDPDDQELTYSWSVDADGGSFEDPTLQTVTWTAPELEGDSAGKRFSFYVVVQDADGYEVWEFGEIDVYPEGELATRQKERVRIEQSVCGIHSGQGLSVWLSLCGLLLLWRRGRDGAAEGPTGT